MRSEERAGIISILMLFLWGTLITEPFHIFARFIARAVHYACKGIGISGIAASLILYVVVVSVVILMQKLAPTKLGVFIPCAISVVFIAMLLVKAFMNRSVVVSDALCLAVPAAIALVFYIMKFEKVYIFACRGTCKFTLIRSPCEAGNSSGKDPLHNQI